MIKNTYPPLSQQPRMKKIQYLIRKVLVFGDSGSPYLRPISTNSEIAEALFEALEYLENLEDAQPPEEGSFP